MTKHAKVIVQMGASTLTSTHTEQVKNIRHPISRHTSSEVLALTHLRAHTQRLAQFSLTWHTVVTPSVTQWSVKIPL